MPQKAGDPDTEVKNAPAPLAMTPSATPVARHFSVCVFKSSLMSTYFSSLLKGYLY
jgi:hypothetical protein